jgi:nicotinamidase-related amidase
MSYYFNKYLKYKGKYLELQKKQYGGAEAVSSVTSTFTPRKLVLGEDTINLLLIDPQIDFNDVNEEEYKPKLTVPGSNEDHKRLVQFIQSNKNKINKVFVSQDTHTPNHIGHYGFWEQLQITNGKEEYIPLAPETSFTQVTIIGNDIKGNGTLTLRPRQNCGSQKQYAKLQEYVKEYIKMFDNEKHKNKVVMIWPAHCLEDTKGQEVVPMLKTVLDTLEGENRVTYHVKGQNNLTEMYSIFGAEVENLEQGTPKSMTVSIDELKNYKYVGGTYPPSINLNTSYESNKGFMASLFEGGKTVYVTGQARTHCVLESVKHLMRYIEETGIDKDKLGLIHNCSSPIPGFHDTIKDDMINKGFTNIVVVDEVKI